MILISGANGFIGGRLARQLQIANVPCRFLVRSPGNKNDCIISADLKDIDALYKACSGVETVFHCAGYAHSFSTPVTKEAEKHWAVNFEGTRNFVEAAGLAGVRTFIFLSSVKAMGQPGDICADENFPGMPESPYGKAKRAAEDTVLEVGKRYGMHVVNLRLVMVYGFGGKGNLQRMAQLVRRGWFPPLPETNNRRSMIHVDDVVAVMRLVADDPKANGKTYIVAGPDAPSGRGLFDALRSALDLPSCPWTVPYRILRMTAQIGDLLQLILHKRMPVNSETLDRLLCSACYSSVRIEAELGWRAKISLQEGLLEMCKG